MMIEALWILDQSPSAAVQLAAVHLCQAIDLMDVDAL
ncbi:hypothetical protein BW41_00630 [Sphingomonas sp. RIT328]|nr:hypothetical protein BW41_00630 [Sphingomonas sp. RIT328]